MCYHSFSQIYDVLYSKIAKINFY